jgi:hypothetical protein
MLYCRPHGGGKFGQLTVTLCTIHMGYLHRLNVDDKSLGAISVRADVGMFATDGDSAQTHTNAIDS